MAYVWTDDPLLINETKNFPVHIQELRDNLNNERVRRGLSALTFTDFPIVGNALEIRSIHIQELRTGVDSTFLTNECSTHNSVIFSLNDSSENSAYDDSIDLTLQIDNNSHDFPYCTNNDSHVDNVQCWDNAVNDSSANNPVDTAVCGVHNDTVV